MNFQRPVLLMVFSLIPIIGLAEVYSWKDASGKVHYGDRPPASKQGETRKLAAPPPVDTEAIRKVAGEKQLSEREEQKKSAEDAKKAQEQQKNDQIRAENCSRAKSNLAALESGQARFTLDAKGERVALDGAVRDAELARARKSVDDWCNSPAK